jgi:ribosomal protein S18 acetylase RimI-like enzyme
VQALWTSCGLPPASDQEWEVLLRDAAGPTLLVADDGAVLGVAVITYDGWRAFISHVAVAPEARRKGVARTLMYEAERELQARGARLVFALVKESMTDGLALLGSSGYEPEGDVAFVKALGHKPHWPRIVPER